MRRRTVILRHELPDGSVHFDWMLAMDEPVVAPLATWRTSDRPDLVPIGGRIRVERLADHRPIYLDYEGAISGGRGDVRRVRAGWWTPAEGNGEAAPSLALGVDWGDGLPAQRWEIEEREALRVG